MNNGIQNRKSNYDLLKFLAAFSVVIIHVSGVWLSGYTENYKMLSAADKFDAVMVCIYNSCVRFAIPSFLMMTGALTLGQNRNADFGYYYKKVFFQNGTHTLLFTLIYGIYGAALCFLGEKGTTKDLWALFTDILTGKVMYHMWYIYMLAGVYLLIPVVIIFKNSVSDEIFGKATVLFVILACLSNWTSGYSLLSWDIGQSFEYLSYVILGYWISRNVKEHNEAGLALIVLGILLEIFAAFLQYKLQLSQGIFEDNMLLMIVSPFSPLIMVSSVLIFCGFSMLKCRVNHFILKTSMCSLIIYFSHAGVWDVLCKIIEKKWGIGFLYRSLNGFTWIPAFSIIVFSISVCLSLLYMWLYRFVFSSKRTT